ncbi:MAG: glycogen synthase [Candidatus Omnitrophica bacterium]|nr:glycogen synthase [Candidatus Omnitrophota bacterium]
MKIAFFSSEVFPFAKTGGLADVSGSLPGALAKQGAEVKVFMPLYNKIKPQKMFDDYGTSQLAKKVEIIFVRNDDYFLREHLYTSPRGDYPDNLERFSFFCKKSFDILKRINFSPDIFHANDWQSSLINIYLKILYKNVTLFKRAKSVLTIHNLAYQGVFEKEKFPQLGINPDYFSVNHLEFYNKINLLKGGIIFSDMVNTVSPRYAKQIQTPDYGCGLDGVLREKRERLCGILNAIDYDVWNPAKDKLIYTPYSLETLENKAINKRKFQKEMGLKVNKKIFLLGIVTRLAEQKGIDIFSKALDKILGNHQVVILGTGDEKYHKILKTKAKKHKSLSLHLKFDEVLAHRIYASCDAFLMPSRFEPCGLSQMISYKYATVPVVHYTGGLVDTVIDYQDGGGGFVFHNYHHKDLVAVIERAYKLFSRNSEWSELLKKITGFNFSWAKTAKEYMDIYKRCQLLSSAQLKAALK